MLLLSDIYATLLDSVEFSALLLLWSIKFGYSQNCAGLFSLFYIFEKVFLVGWDSKIESPVAGPFTLDLKATQSKDYL